MIVNLVWDLKWNREILEKIVNYLKAIEKEGFTSYGIGAPNGIYFPYTYQ